MTGIGYGRTEKERMEKEMLQEIKRIVQEAVQEAWQDLTVTLDGETVGRLAAPYVSEALGEVLQSRRYGS